MTRSASIRYAVKKLLRVLRIALVLPWARLIRQGPGPTLRWMLAHGRLLNAYMDSLPYSRVLPTLYVGGQINEAEWAALQALGVTAVLTLRDEHDDLAGGLSIPADRYLRLPYWDDTPISLADLRRGADWTARQIADGGAVYVHCGSGVGRAPAMGAAYLIAHEGQTTDAALATIRAARPFISLSPGQVESLRRFEVTIRAPRTS